jgi:hypothetical protein
MKESAGKNKNYALRIDAHLVKPLQELKKQNRRSLNAEINAALAQWVAHPKGFHTETQVAPSQSVPDTHTDPKPKQVRAKKQPKAQTTNPVESGTSTVQPSPAEPAHSAPAAADPETSPGDA